MRLIAKEETGEAMVSFFPPDSTLANAVKLEACALTKGTTSLLFTTAMALECATIMGMVTIILLRMGKSFLRVQNLD